MSVMVKRVRLVPFHEGFYPEEEEEVAGVLLFLLGLVLNVTVNSYVHIGW